MSPTNAGSQYSHGADYNDAEHELDIQEPYLPLVPMNTIDQQLPRLVVPGSCLESHAINKSLQSGLYLSHFLSTWNARLFEFGAVLFLASIYPGSLLPMSVYALVRNAAAVLFSHSIGTWIDQADRLIVVRASIVGQRTTVVTSCCLLGFMNARNSNGGVAVNASFVGVVILACVEKLCSIMNTVAVERDWVVAMTEGHDGLRQGGFHHADNVAAMNAQMRRIDLLCKLLGPLAISIVDMISTQAAILVVLAINIPSIFIEYICIARVYYKVPSLRRRPTDAVQEAVVEELPLTERTASPALLQSSSPSTVAREPTTFGGLGCLWTGCIILSPSALKHYVTHPAFIPSFSLSLLYFTVLSFSGQMITFLVCPGYTSLQVGILRTLSSLLELSATWIAPRLVDRVGAVRGGLWSLSWLMGWVAAGVTWYFADIELFGNKSGGSSSDEGNKQGLMNAATGLAICVALSRLGLWGYDLCAQFLVQEEVEAIHRGSFSSVEAAFQNFFELLSFATTIVFSKPEQFHWPVAISGAAVYAAGGLHALFVRRKRGHLFHPPPCLNCKA